MSENPFFLKGEGVHLKFKVRLCLIFLFADPFILQELNAWGKNITAMSNEEIGRTKVLLDGDTIHCRLKECNLGNFLADAYVDYVGTTTMQYASIFSLLLTIFSVVAE